MLKKQKGKRNILTCRLERKKGNTILIVEKILRPDLDLDMVSFQVGWLLLPNSRIANVSVEHHRQCYYTVSTSVRAMQFVEESCS